MLVYTRKIKIKNYINDDLEDSDSDSDYNNETESDIDNEAQFVKSILTIIKS